MSKEICLNVFERYISGNASVEEVALLQSFLKNDVNLNRWLEDQIMTSADTIDSDVKMRMLENMRSRIDYNTPQIPVKNFRFYLKKIANIAAVLFVLIAGVNLYFLLKPQKTESFEIATNQGEKANLILPDGSKIIINSGSKIVYYSDYNEKNRFIKLEGEAFFDVRNNPEKPFVVDCNSLKISVLGTIFDIKAYQAEDIISIVLNSGKIQLTTPKEKIEMAPNNRIVYNKTTQTTTLEKVNAQDYTDWTQMSLHFDNESLEAIMKTISQKYNIDIVFENSYLKNQRFTGTIDYMNINNVLNAIKQTSSIDYRIKDGVVYLYKKN